MKPQISTMSLDAVYLPMVRLMCITLPSGLRHVLTLIPFQSDLTDDHAMNVDFHAMADKVAVNLRRMKVPVEEQAGFMKQIWNDMVDDMLSVSKKRAAV